MTLRTLWSGILLGSLLAPPAAAQEWNAPVALALVERGIARRAFRLADSSLVDFHVRAHGFVFFLGQLAEGLQEPPRLVRSDELALEVYWKAPNRSKQRIVGWRDRMDLPTDIQYHRDHLGIIQNNFGDRIRMGEGQEVRDVLHPLAPTGPALYDYQLVDSLQLVLPRRSVRVQVVRVRPKDYDTPAVVGSLYFDAATAELVVFRFSFTRPSYLDESLEDITIVLENGLWDERYWLPRRQEIEIRRRTRILDLPARGIIRGRWEIDDYEFNVGLDDRLFLGPEIVAAPQAERDTFAWGRPLHEAIQSAAVPAVRLDLEEARVRIREIAGARALSGLATARPGVGAVSELAHFNRVEGLALGAGGVLRPAGGAVEMRGWASFGLADRRVKARGVASLQAGPWTFLADVERRIRDVGGEPVIAPVLNSLLAQELARDYGDYVLLDAAAVGLRRVLGTRGAISATAGVEHARTVPQAATPAHGKFDPNPALGADPYWVGRLSVEHRSAELAVRGGVSGTATVEGGVGSGEDFVRIRVAAQAHHPFGATRLVSRAWVGWGSAALPAYRAFVLGGRGSLVGEPFRAWGGRHAAWGQIEWDVPVPVPELALGPLVTTGDRATLAPFVAGGWADAAVPGMPWTDSDGVRVIAGLGAEWFHGLFRAEAGVSLRDGTVGVTLDVRRDLWGIL